MQQGHFSYPRLLEPNPPTPPYAHTHNLHLYWLEGSLSLSLSFWLILVPGQLEPEKLNLMHVVHPRRAGGFR